tara:strand:+ start:158 stop:295 length:138 start_codon:yes stop_codon:yes gene_type:complete
MKKGGDANEPGKGSEVPQQDVERETADEGDEGDKYREQGNRCHIA